MMDYFCIFLLTLVTYPISVKGELVIQKIRLVNGPVVSSGRVEVQINGIWGTVCDDQWDNLDASVVCKSLNYPDGGTATKEASFGQGVGTIFLSDVACEGDEVGLAQCKMSTSIGLHNCQHSEDAGVVCQTTGQPLPVITSTARPIGPQQDNCASKNTEVRLIGPTGIQGIGLVEVNNAGTWGSVCDDNFELIDARVVCAMLCYDTTYARSGALEEIIKDIIPSPIIVDNVRCTGSEATIKDCPHNPWNIHDCGPKEVASVTCVNLNSKPPDPPVPILRCLDGYLIALFNRSRDRYLEEKHLTIPGSDSSCNVIKETDINFITVRITFETCNTKVEVNATHLIYSNIINYAVTHIDVNKIRVNTYPIYVYCEMLRNVSAERNLETLTESVTKRAEGRFIIDMTFYKNNSFDNPVTQYPVRMPLGEWLNVALLLESVDSRLKLIVPDCVATPSPDPNDPIFFPLFEKNCAKEPTLGFFPLSQIKFGYRYQPFMFYNNSQVYLHCGAFVCLVEETGAECDRSCNTTKPTATGRKKRDIQSPASPRQKYYINSGPLYVYKKPNTETVIERVDRGSFKTTVSIPIPTEIQEKLLDRTTKHTVRPTTNASETTVTTVNHRGEVVTTSVITTTESSPTESARERPTAPDLMIERVAKTDAPIPNPTEGVWIEFPRRPGGEKSETVVTEKSVFQSNLRFGISSACCARQTISIFITTVFLFLL